MAAQVCQMPSVEKHAAAVFFFGFVHVGRSVAELTTKAVESASRSRRKKGATRTVQRRMERAPKHATHSGFGGCAGRLLRQRVGPVAFPTASRQFSSSCQFTSP